MNRLFDDVYRGTGAPAGRTRSAQDSALFDARIDVSETDRELRVRAELPGVREEDVDVTLDDDTLTIRGEKKFEQEGGGDREKYHVVERSYGTFQRSLRLPFAVNPDEVRADFRNGILTVTAPKTAQQQRTRRIQIGSTNAQPEAALRDENGDQTGPTPERSETGGGEQPIAH
jgi:HSP20 family protein